MHVARVLCSIFALGLVALPARAADAPPAGGSELLLIFDASGSMWGQVQKQSKIEIAKRVLDQVLAKVPATTPVGLIAYGHRSKTDCADIETVVAPGATDRAALLKAVAAIQPKGKTPIAGSVKKAIELLRARETASTVVLISDGIETCDGDACALVREARAAGLKFVMHVVGFDMGDADVSQLECAAQAGGGLYFSATDAGGLAAALEQAVAMTPETPGGRLSVKTTADGGLTDVLLTVRKADGGEIVTESRTYTGADTNPRVLPLPDGRYDVSAEAVRIAGRPTQSLKGIEIRDGATVEKAIDFGTGMLRVKATRNGALSDVKVEVLRAGTRELAAAGRTYRDAKNNPKEFRLPAGVYDVEITAIEIEGDPMQRWEAVEVAGATPVERAHDFRTGTLRIGATSGGKLVDAVVAVSGADGASVAQGRTYDHAKSNPKSFELAPGAYVVTLTPVKPKGLQGTKLQVEVSGGGTTERIAELMPGSPAEPRP